MCSVTPEHYQGGSKEAWEPHKLFEVNKLRKQFLMACDMVPKTYQASGRYFAPYFVQIKISGVHYNPRTTVKEIGNKVNTHWTTE